MNDSLSTPLTSRTDPTDDDALHTTHLQLLSNCVYTPLKTGISHSGFRTNLCMDVYMYKLVCMCIYKFYMCVYVCLCKCVCICLYAYACMYKCVCVCI